MAGFQGRGHFVVKHLPAGHINRRHEVHEATLHRDVRGVQFPYAIGLSDAQMAKQVGIDLVSRCWTTGAERWGYGTSAHVLLRRAHTDFLSTVPVVAQCDGPPEWDHCPDTLP